MNITESYIYADHDMGFPGDIYYKIWVNGNYTRYPQEGDISASDGDNLLLDIIGFEGWTWNNTVIVEVWDSDTYPDPDDSLGKIIYSTGNPIDETVELRTDIGDANVTIQFNVTDTKNTFTTEEVLWGYQPYLYIDDETSGTEEPDEIYGRVCIGYDDEMGKDLWALQYFFYWEIETYGTYPAEVQLHKYDYEEVLIFLDPSDITKPVRIVYDEAQNTAYPDHKYIIYEKNAASPGTYIQTVNFAEEYQPFLGTNLTIDYKTEDLILLSNDFIEGQFGGQTVKLTIDTFYHAFDNGEGSNETSYNYRVLDLSDSVLKDWYSHLNESLYGNIHHIPVIDYTTPEISPFTFDVSNPFQCPYIINAWSNVMEDLDAFRMAQSQDITFSARMNLTITLAVEAILKIEYPDVVDVGESYELNYSIEMLNEKLILTTEYALDVNLSANFWFLGGTFILYQNGSFSVDIPLSTINSLLDCVGVSPQKLVDKITDKINTYLTEYYLEIDYIEISPTLLGTVLNSSVRIHFWDIAKDLIPPIVSIVTPEIYPLVNTAFKVIDRIISHIDLEAQFLLQTMIIGQLSISDGTQAQLNQNTIEFNESDTLVPINLIISDTPTNPNLKITLNNLANGVNFFIDWYFDTGLEQPFSFFIDDFRVYIGRYPSYQKDLPEGLVKASVSSVILNITIAGVTLTSSITTTNQAGSGFTFAILIAITVITLIGIGWPRGTTRFSKKISERANRELFE